MRGVTLRTGRLVLRPFTKGDVEDALHYWNDEEFARFLPHIPQPFTRADAERFVATNMEEPWERFATFAVEFDGRVIGTVNLDFALEEQNAMLGYAISREHWGIGIAPEAARAVIAWGFGNYDLARIWASTDARHVRSRRVMEKLGMRHERTLVSDHQGRDGTAVDEVVYGLLREDWEAASPHRSSAPA